MERQPKRIGSYSGVGGRQRIERGVELFQLHTNLYIVWCCRTTTTEDESVDQLGDVKA